MVSLNLHVVAYNAKKLILKILNGYIKNVIQEVGFILPNAVSKNRNMVG